MIETEALLTELLKRFDCAIFVGARGHRLDEAEMRLEVTGDTLKVLGLAVLAKRRVEDFHIETSRDYQGD